MIQDALVKVMFSPQRRSRRFLVGDVENQPEILNQRSPGFANRSDMKKRFEKISIFLSQRRLMVAKRIHFRQLFEQRPALRRLRNEVLKQVRFQKFLLTSISKHSRQCRIRSNHFSAWAADKCALLN